MRTAALVHAYNNLGACLLWQRRPEGAEYLRRSRDLALEHHLPDDVGRAYANLSGQGNRIFPFAYAESEAILVEGVDTPRGRFPTASSTDGSAPGWGEFLLVTGRWAEAEPVIFGIDPDAAEAYLGSEVRSLRAHLLAWSGRYEEAVRSQPSRPRRPSAMGDIQAVLPPLAALASAQAGLGEDVAAVASIDRGIELRGTSEEATISAWYLFEATDTLSAIAARDPSSAAVRAGLGSVAAYARASAPRRRARATSS